MAIENKTVESIPAITIRFAGDSGDGMQLVGTRFTDTSAIFGNDLATLLLSLLKLEHLKVQLQEYPHFKYRLQILIS